MKILALMTASVLALGSLAGVSAQTRAATDDEIRLTRTMLQTKRQEIVSNAIHLTADEEKLFWQLYREWRHEMARIGDRRVDIIKSISGQMFDQIDDAGAKSLLDEWLSIQADTAKLQARYVKRFRKILPEKKVARFFQLESKLDAITNYDLVERVPLVE
jgi:hypothetical protein